MRTSLRSLAIAGVGLAVAASIGAVPDDRAVAPVAATGVTSDARAARVPAAVGDPLSRRPVDPVQAVRVAAIAAVEADEGVALADGGRCAVDDLEVSYVHPGAGWVSGAWVGELGPAPTTDSSAANGIVRCAGSRYAFVGFEAVRDGTEWHVGVVPDPHRDAGEQGHGHDHDHEPPNEPDPDAPEQPAPTAAPAAAPAPVGTPPSLVGRGTGPAIEGYARYEAQTTCSSSAQVGSLALRDLLLRTYPGTRSLGIVRGCSVGGRSEHKEGRAFDWGVLASRAAEKAAADDFVTRLTATDAYGNHHALARRMGVMYVIWNRRIWSAYNANAGWRAYNGSSPHTDHVHISLSWAGARGQTSFWTGQVVEGLPSAPVGGGSLATGGATTHPAPVGSDDPTSAPEDDERSVEETSERRARRESEEAARLETEAQEEREEADRRAREQAEREAEATAKAAAKALQERERAEREARKQAEREARRAREEADVTTSSASDDRGRDRAEQVRAKGEGKGQGQGKGKGRGDG